MRFRLAMALPGTSEDFFNNVQQDILDLLALELYPEGWVAQYLLVIPEFVHGNLLKGSGVVSACGE